MKIEFLGTAGGVPTPGPGSMKQSKFHLITGERIYTRELMSRVFVDTLEIVKKLEDTH